jgi:hypothetical protein
LETRVVRTHFSALLTWCNYERISQEQLTKEVEELRAKSAARRATREMEEGAELSIIVDEAGAVPSVIVT